MPNIKIAATKGANCLQLLQDINPNLGAAASVDYVMLGCITNDVCLNSG